MTALAGCDQAVTVQLGTPADSSPAETVSPGPVAVTSQAGLASGETAAGCHQAVTVQLDTPACLSQAEIASFEPVAG